MFHIFHLMTSFGCTEVHIWQVNMNECIQKTNQTHVNIIGSRCVRRVRQTQAQLLLLFYSFH